MSSNLACDNPIFARAPICDQLQVYNVKNPLKNVAALSKPAKKLEVGKAIRIHFFRHNLTILKMLPKLALHGRKYNYSYTLFGRRPPS